MFVICAFIKKISSYCFIIEGVFAVTYIVWLCLPISIPMLFTLLIPILEILLFFLFKDYTIKFSTYYIVLRINLVIWMLTWAHKMILGLENISRKDVPLFISAFLYMVILICALCLMIVTGEKCKNTIKAINVKDYLENFGEKIPDDEDNGDVIICNDLETGEPVILEGNDRLLHTFVDGPTGGGKTSQILAPIAYQDITKKRGVTVIEPKGDFAETAYAIAKLSGRKDAILFNPVDPNCPKFNVLDGPEDLVVETLSTTFQLLTPDSQTYFKDNADVLIRNALMVAKRLEEAYINPHTGLSDRVAILTSLSEIVNNPDRRGEQRIREFKSLPTVNKDIKKQNEDVASYFMNEYYKETSIIYKNTSGVRNQLAKLTQNKHLRRVLNPETGKSEFNFDDALKNGQCICISTEQGALGDLSSYLGYFFIFNYQAAALRRKKKDRKKVNYLIIDEAQKVFTEQSTILIEQGRSYKISCILSTQARAELGIGKNSKKLLASVSANARNNIVLPGICAEDREYYQELFGTIKTVETRKGESKPKFSLFGENRSGSTESTTYIETEKPLFTGTDIAYREFSEITYGIIKRNTVQRARVGKAAFIDQDFQKKINEFIDNYDNEVELNQQTLDKEEQAKKQKLYEEFYNRRTGSTNRNNNTGVAVQNKKQEEVKTEKGKKVKINYK